MPTPEYASATIAATSSTDDITAADWRLIRGSQCRINAPTQADLTLLGRDRRPVFLPSQSLATVKIRAHYREHSACEIAAATSTKALYLTTIPAIPAPTGQVFANSKALKEQRLPKSRSQTFTFAIAGKRLKNLQVSFTLRNLQGGVVLVKTVKIAPGGVAIEEFIEDADGMQTITGCILLLPHETKFVGTGELELHYILQIGNGSSREHLLEANYLSFYDV